MARCRRRGCGLLPLARRVVEEPGHGRLLSPGASGALPPMHHSRCPEVQYLLHSTLQDKPLTCTSAMRGEDLGHGLLLSASAAHTWHSVVTSAGHRRLLSTRARGALSQMHYSHEGCQCTAVNRYNSSVAYWVSDRHCHPGARGRWLAIACAAAPLRICKGISLQLLTVPALVVKRYWRP